MVHGEYIATGWGEATFDVGRRGDAVMCHLNENVWGTEGKAKGEKWGRQEEAVVKSSRPLI